jgi:nucleoside-diphosphate-sugar epimerase
MTTDFGGATVLVTGGAGFIGSHIVEALLAQHAQVRVLDNFVTGLERNVAHCLDRIELLRGDIRDLDTCRRACQGARYVVHQAALGSVPRSMEDPQSTLAVNAQGTANVLAAAREAGIERVVYASSSAVYGDSAAMPKREGEEGAPLSPYALSKRMNEELADVFARCYGMTLVGLRYFNVYGPRQRPDGAYAAVIPRFFAACAAGEAPVIFGDGLQSRDFTFVADVVAANLASLRAPLAGAHALNIGAGATTTVLDVARTICRVSGAGVEPKHAPARAGDIKHSLADTERAYRAIGFRAETRLEEGLLRTVERMRDAA